VTSRWKTLRWVAVVGFVALVAAAVLWPFLGKVARNSAVEPAPTSIDYIVVPHPDDEFQAWSLIGHDDSTYKIFILATRGEETGFCEPGGYRKGLQSGLEPAPEPVPRGKWTRSCEAARLSSWVGYFEQMAGHDPTLPQDLRRRPTAGPFPVDAGPMCRYDGSDECISDTTAEVWVDEAGRGALVAFNLGDGDLTRREVSWAVRMVRANREALGLEKLPNGDVIGASFANRSYDCFSYPHPDHRAVHEALHDVDFGMGDQIAPTCGDDPEASRSAVVSDTSAEAAFEIGPDGERLGAHTKHYGWLANPYYRLDRQAQRQLFHTHQHFWVR
jgi:hypothetical protein